MNRSESITELAKALVKAQVEIEAPHFDSVNPHFKSKFASLSSVRAAVLPVFNKYGLSLTQFPVASPDMAGCHNLLMHTSGEWIEEVCLVPMGKKDAQGAGACITYARRFSIQAIAGVVADEDDDGNSAVSPERSARPADQAEGLRRMSDDGEAKAKRIGAMFGAEVVEVVEDDGPRSCPKCGGKMWDNRKDKKNPKAPDFKCRDKACDGVIWPPRKAKAAPSPEPESAGPADGLEPKASKALKKLFDTYGYDEEKAKGICIAVSEGRGTGLHELTIDEIKAFGKEYKSQAEADLAAAPVF